MIDSDYKMWAIVATATAVLIGGAFLYRESIRPTPVAAAVPAAVPHFPALPGDKTPQHRIEDAWQSMRDHARGVR